MGRTWVTPDFGERLKELILKNYRGVIPFCMAKGFVPPDIYRWIKGQSPTYEAVVRLAAALNIVPGKLAWGDDLGAAAVQNYIRGLVTEPIRQPKIGFTGGGAGAAPLPGELETGERRDGGLCQPVRKPLAPVRALPRRVSRAS